MISQIWTYAIVSTVAVSLVSLAGVFAIYLSKQTLQKWVFVLVALSVGALFGDAFFHIIPELFEGGATTAPAFYILVGIIIFFILEKFLHWGHRHSVDTAEDCEGDECEHEPVSPFGYLNIVSDGIHNLIDGIIIGASYFVSIEVGIATTIAVFFHEIPQEISDFGVLIHAGFSRARALLFNFLSGLLAVVGTLFALYFTLLTDALLEPVLAVAAGGFIYIAGSDLVPELHKTTDIKKSLIQLAALLAGVAIMVLLLLFE